MSWEEDYEFSNGADGSCQSCGAETDAEWHALCSSCWRKEQGWSRPARPEPDTPPESFVAGLASVRETIKRQEVRIAYLEQQLNQLRRAA